MSNLSFLHQPDITSTSSACCSPLISTRSPEDLPKGSGERAPFDRSHCHDVQLSPVFVTGKNSMLTSTRAARGTRIVIAGSPNVAPNSAFSWDPQRWCQSISAGPWRTTSCLVLNWPSWRNCLATKILHLSGRKDKHIVIAAADFYFFDTLLIK
ncbi:uncharacterized protein LOC144010766 isoform X2 [Festucalex cinctus]